MEPKNAHTTEKCTNIRCYYKLSAVTSGKWWVSAKLFGDKSPIVKCGETKSRVKHTVLEILVIVMK
jgi:hypothetical protein